MRFVVFIYGRRLKHLCLVEMASGEYVGVRVQHTGSVIVSGGNEAEFPQDVVPIRISSPVKYIVNQ